MKNYPLRNGIVCAKVIIDDLGDIERVMAIHGKELDWALIEEYFSLFGLGNIMKELREKYHAS